MAELRAPAGKRENAMKTYHILFNPHAGNGHGEEEAHRLDAMLEGAALVYHNMTQIADYEDFFRTIPADEDVVLCGGDGTLNRFINDTAGVGIPNELLYFGVGSGNDFLHDLGKEKGAAPFPVKKYLENLPTVTVKGRTYRFLNGIGYGIDGYCCQVGDEQREKSDKPINYTAIAIKGLLFHYKPTNAVITVDGVRHAFKKVWLAPTMFGRHYGGGMMPTPDQDRSDPSRKLSVMVYYGAGKLKALMVFPSIFQGKHVEHREMVSVLTGHDITVEFDQPTPLQVDGETILDVKSYHALGVPVRETANV